LEEDNDISAQDMYLIIFDLLKNDVRLPDGSMFSSQKFKSFIINSPKALEDEKFLKKQIDYINN
jgi:hypothetical protein